MHPPADVFEEQNANSLKMVKLLVAKAFPVDKLKLLILPQKGTVSVISFSSGVFLSTRPSTTPQGQGPSLTSFLVPLRTSNRVGASDLLFGLSTEI